VYFLNSAMSGMRRRLVATVLTIFGGSALLVASASIGLWSLWLTGQKDHLRAARSATVFVDTAELPVLEEVLTKAIQMPGVETARIVSSEEFRDFLRSHFPDLHNAVSDLGEDIFPRMLEVVFPADLHAFARKDTVLALGDVPNVARVDDGSVRLGKALSSLHWLGLGGMALAVGLWLVLFIVCLGHYQSILYTDAQEISLIRSFGATKLAIIAPWFIEALVQSLASGLICVLGLFLGKNMMTELYNQFFGTIGYEPFQITLSVFASASMMVFAMAFSAHLLAAVTALFRGRIA